MRDDPALYDDGRIANAAWLLRRANYVLADNVKLGPWIHVESAIDLHSLLTDGEDIEVRAVVADNVETKGHLMVVLDVQMLSGSRLVMSCRHWAIYEPRQVRQAARHEGAGSSGRTDPNWRTSRAPKPGPEDVLVRVRACALNRADLAMARGVKHGGAGGAGAGARSRMGRRESWRPARLFPASSRAIG